MAFFENTLAVNTIDLKPGERLSYMSVHRMQLDGSYQDRAYFYREYTNPRSWHSYTTDWFLIPDMSTTINDNVILRTDIIRASSNFATIKYNVDQANFGIAQYDVPAEETIRVYSFSCDKDGNSLGDQGDIGTNWTGDGSTWISNNPKPLAPDSEYIIVYTEFKYLTNNYGYPGGPDDMRPKYRFGITISSN